MVKTLKLKYLDFNNENQNQNYYKNKVNSEFLPL